MSKSASVPTTLPRKRLRTGLVILLLLLPLAAINLVNFLIPLIRLASISLMESQAGILTENWSLSAYVAFFTDPFSLDLIWNSVLMSFLVTVLTLICAYPIALFLHRVNPRWRNLLLVITISPLLVSAVVRTYGWMILLGDRGVINGILMSSGLIESPFRLINNALGVYIGLVEILIPYMALSLIAGFGRLEQSLEEAAASLGAGAFTRFRRVIFPLTLPGVALGCLLCFVLAISSFVTPKLLGGGRVFLLATEIYDQAIIQLEWPKAAATSIFVLLIFGLALGVYGRISRRLG